MALTVAQLITRTRDNTNYQDTSVVTNATIVQYLNDAQRSAARQHMWRELLQELSTTLTNGTAAYLLSVQMPRMKEVLGIRIIDNGASQWLIERSQRWLNQYEPYPPSLSSGKPDYYVIDGLYARYFPRPNAAYTVYQNICNWPTEFSTNDTSADCDISVIDDALVAYATAEIFRSKQQFDSAEHWERRWFSRLREARVQDMKRPNWMPRPDGVVGGGSGGLPSEYWLNPWVGIGE